MLVCRALQTQVEAAGDLADAQDTKDVDNLCQRSSAIRGNVEEQEHREVAVTLSWLLLQSRASLRRRTGLCSRTIAIGEAVYGADYPEVASVLANSADLVGYQMGDAVTEAGAISATAAFFRQNMDACAWAEKTVSPSSISHNSAPGEPPLLRFPLRPTGSSLAPGVHGRHRSNFNIALPTALALDGGGRAAAPLELVVSRGPGPEFSDHEARVAALAVALLSQALARVRDRAAFSEAKGALEESFRGMIEASDAVAALVQERGRREKQEARRDAEVAERHEESLLSARGALERARGEAEELRGQLVVAEQSLAAVSAAVNGVCQVLETAGVCQVFETAAAAAAAAGGPSDAAAEREAGLSDGRERAKVIAVVERAARDALRCSSARVMLQRRRSTSQVGAGSAAMAVGAEAEAHRWRATVSTPAIRDRRFRQDTASSDDAGLSTSDDESDAAEQLVVPIEYCGNGAEALVMSIRGVVSEPPPRPFTDRDRAAASAIAACSRLGLLVLKERDRTRRALRRIEAGERARAEREALAAADAAAAEAVARARGERAVTGMRALVVAAKASKAQAKTAEEATRRAEGHTYALRRLLQGLSEAGNDHGAVAGVVYRRAGAAVPGCVGAVLLTPRGGGGEGAGTPTVSFSPDPRAWATAAASKVIPSGDGPERDGRVRKSFGRKWARRIEEAAAQASVTGETVCVMSNNVCGNGDGGDGGDGGGLSRRVMVCFSPTLTTSASKAGRQGCAGSIRCRHTNPGPPAASDHLRIVELGKVQGTRDGSGSPLCLIAWMLRPGDREENSEASWTAVSSLTENVSSSSEAMYTSPSPPPPPPLPPPLPKLVSSTVEAVAHAVGLALSSVRAAAAPAGACGGAGVAHAHRQTSALSATRLVGRRPSQEARGARDEGSREKARRREEELRRLRDGTAALADRVQTLEGRAAGLRASEARSAAALAKARAEAGAVKGELQLTALELERERRKPLALRRPTENLLLSAGREESGKSGAFGPFRPFGLPPRTPSAFTGAPLCGLSGSSRNDMGSSSVRRARCAGRGEVLGIFTPSAEILGVSPASTAEQGLPLSGGIAGAKDEGDASGGDTRDGGDGGEEPSRSKTAALKSTGLPTPTSSLHSPLGDVGGGGCYAASSAALQHMASVHARLSNSLKSSSFFGATSRAGTASAPIVGPT